jgi:hypothetical protein
VSFLDNLIKFLSFLTENLPEMPRSHTSRKIFRAQCPLFPEVEIERLKTERLKERKREREQIKTAKDSSLL